MRDTQNINLKKKKIANLEDELLDAELELEFLDTGMFKNAHLPCESVRFAKLVFFRQAGWAGPAGRAGRSSQAGSVRRARRTRRARWASRAGHAGRSGSAGWAGLAG